MNKNKGFSFIELLLVISIITILTGIVTLSIGLVSRSNVNGAAKKIDSCLSQANTVSMAKGSMNGKLYLFFRNKRVYCYVGNTSNTDLIEDNKVEVVKEPIKVRMVLRDGSDIILSDSDNNVEILFDSSSGSFRKLVVDGSEVDYCEEIEIYSDKSSVSIKLYRVTGKHVIE